LHPLRLELTQQEECILRVGSAFPLESHEPLIEKDAREFRREARCQSAKKEASREAGHTASTYVPVPGIPAPRTRFLEGATDGITVLEEAR
jgi:hypothetical protein